MTFNPSVFLKFNVIDTCAVWNVLSSQSLYARAKNDGIEFYCAGLVLNECLHKPRKQICREEMELQVRLRSAINNGDFRETPLAVEDLQAVQILETRQRLGKGELTSIARAINTRQAFMTDDQEARKFATATFARVSVQTTPHLFSWLVFTSSISAQEASEIIEDNIQMKRPLKPHLEKAFEIARRARSLCQPPEGR
ncbi:MAG: hypothetical protein LBO66_00210 [Deltaproteobacteria bacterium]|jgi:predicted nucleic acid-binding protein|nr:hypothetical protein [Deltaproteobacteria bacterium]